MITLKQLRYLSALAEQRHFGRAAEACSVTQPALSMQIRDLERELGTPLVERRPGDVVLTDTGRDIVARSDQILAAARDLVDLARHRDRVLAGGMTLGVIPTLAPYVLPRLLPPLQGRYPALRLELRETQTKVLLDELIRGTLDVVLLALPVAAEEIDTAALFDDPFLLAVPADGPHPASGRVMPRDIDQQRLILLEEGHCLRDQALAFCRTADRTMGLGATSLATVMEMVANGFGVTLVPQVAVEVGARDDRVSLLRFASPEPRRTIGLGWRRTSPRKADFLALGSLITEIFGDGARRNQTSVSRPRARLSSRR
jgi:LysR family transcriptional regulator, hydrogen peroxide-inducible genes activator